jgi:hypothetical protein
LLHNAIECNNPVKISPLNPPEGDFKPTRYKAPHRGVWGAAFDEDRKTGGRQQKLVIDFMSLKWYFKTLFFIFDNLIQVTSTLNGT